MFSAKNEVELGSQDRRRKDSKMAARGRKQKASLL
jgi:hypothetical protein